MTIKFSIGLLFLFVFCNCSYNTNDQGDYSGFYIENGPRQGLKYIDSIGPQYDYTCVTTTIRNDSVVPMRLKINFSKEDSTLNDSLKAKVFLLPKRLTTEKKQFYTSMSKELRNFLNGVDEATVSLDTLLSANEKCVMTFGILTNTKYGQPYGIGLRALNKSSSKVTLELSFYRKPGKQYLIPCGEISFASSKN